LDFPSSPPMHLTHCRQRGAGSEARDDWERPPRLKPLSMFTSGSTGCIADSALRHGVTRTTGSARCASSCCGSRSPRPAPTCALFKTLRRRRSSLCGFLCLPCHSFPARESAMFLAAATQPPPLRHLLNVHHHTRMRSFSLMISTVWLIGMLWSRGRFCRPCFQRAGDHSSKCPSCRTVRVIAAVSMHRCRRAFTLQV